MKSKQSFSIHPRVQDRINKILDMVDNKSEFICNAILAYQPEDERKIEVRKVIMEVISEMNLTYAPQQPTATPQEEKISGNIDFDDDTVDAIDEALDDYY